MINEEIKRINEVAHPNGARARWTAAHLMAGVLEIVPRGRASLSKVTVHIEHFVSIKRLE